MEEPACSSVHREPNLWSGFWRRPKTSKKQQLCVLGSALSFVESSANRPRRRGRQGPGSCAFRGVGVRGQRRRRSGVCGIIGYVGPRAAKPLLIQGLERLEYRGYDSAGIALLEDDGLDYTRTVGNLQLLKVAAADNASLATTGLGHTRWATHGRVADENAHPLAGCD